MATKQGRAGGRDRVQGQRVGLRLKNNTSNNKTLSLSLSHTHTHTLTHSLKILILLFNQLRAREIEEESL